MTAQDPLTLPAPRGAAWIRPLARLYLKLRHQVLGRRHRRLVLEQFDGLSLLVLPDVFNPLLFRSSPFLAETLRQSGAAGPGARALDLGTGTGIGALAAARLGYQVVGVDINPEAIRCARLNALLNHLEDRIELRHGDLFEPVRGERFDLVLFNPPFFRGVPRDAYDYAWRSPDVAERFAAGLPAQLKPGGRALLVLSTDGEWQAMLAALGAHGLRAQALAHRDLRNEVLTVYAVGLAE